MVFPLYNYSHYPTAYLPTSGGDPKHVTLLGQSSGGSNIHAHLASPSSRGLFHRAISLSGAYCDRRPGDWDTPMLEKIRKE